MDFCHSSSSTTVASPRTPHGSPPVVTLNTLELPGLLKHESPLPQRNAGACVRRRGIHLHTAVVLTKLHEMNIKSVLLLPPHARTSVTILPNVAVYCFMWLSWCGCCGGGVRLGAGRARWRPRLSTCWTASRCTPSRSTVSTGTRPGRRRRRWFPASWRPGATFLASCTCRGRTSGGTATTPRFTLS